MKNLQIKQHSEVKKLVEKLALDYETQKQQSNLYIKKTKAIKTCKIIFTSLVIIGITTAVFIDSSILKILTAIISVVPLILSCLDNIVDNYKLSITTNKNGESINELKEKAISILYEITYNLNSVANIQKEVDKLNMRKRKVYESVLVPSKKAEKLATKSITINNGNSEDDSLIPEELREIKVEI